jgi:hypothetical protein
MSNSKVGPNAASNARLLSAAGTDNATQVSEGPVDVTFIQGLNAAAAVRWLKLYDTYAGVAPASTDTPKMSIPIPASVAFNFYIGGLRFNPKFGYRLTVNGADNDATAVTAADIVGLNIAYLKV